MFKTQNYQHRREPTTKAEKYARLFVVQGAATTAPAEGCNAAMLDMLHFLVPQMAKYNGRPFPSHAKTKHGDYFILHDCI